MYSYIVLGIAASRRKSYVIAGLEYANKSGTLSCNRGAVVSQHASYTIEVPVGLEILTGSPRLKSGNAQKFVLNRISIATMIQLGEVYQNLMVDVQPTNEKLIVCSKNIIMEATDGTYEETDFYFNDENNQPKLAIVRLLSGFEKEQA